MIMKIFNYKVLIITALFFSCGNNQNNSKEKLEKDLYDEVIGIHDEVMPKMSTILSLEGQLSERMQELDSKNENFQEEIEIYKDQISKLQIADEAMMQWMRNFQVEQEGWSHDSVMSYMEKEKKSISLVRNQMLEVIENSEKLLGN
jgi:hypothetical protein